MEILVLVVVVVVLVVGKGRVECRTVSLRHSVSSMHSIHLTLHTTWVLPPKGIERTLDRSDVRRTDERGDRVQSPLKDPGRPFFRLLTEEAKREGGTRTSFRRRRGRVEGVVVHL